MTYQQIMQDLSNKIYKPIYFLMGEESYFIDKITNFIVENVLPDAEKSFNQTIVYGKETDVPGIINLSRRYPMMSNYQVIIVKEAQNLSKIEDLSMYVELPLKSTILVVNYKYKSLDKRKKLYRLLDKNNYVFESKKLYDNQIPAWVSKYLQRKGYDIVPEAAMMISEYLGTDLSKISNELEKLVILVPKEQKITPALVEQNIGISKEFNVFELSKALGERDILKANKIIYFFSKNPKEHSPLQIIANLYTYFIKVLKYHHLEDKSERNVQAKLDLITSYFVKDYAKAARNYPAAKIAEIISVLRDYDAKSKGVGSVSMDQEDILKEMVYKILH